MRDIVVGVTGQTYELKTVNIMLGLKLNQKEINISYL